MNKQDIEKGRNHAIISYITIIGLIIAYFLNNDADKKSAFTNFHVRQSLGLWLTFYALGYIVGSFDSWVVSSGFYLFFVILFIFGLVGAISGKTQTVPLVGAFYQKIFASIR